MTYSPGLSEVAPRMVGTYTFGWSVLPLERMNTSQPSSRTYQANNLATYHPLLVPVTCVVRRFWWVNGSTVSASYNVDMGIYADSGAAPGALLLSTGSTAQGTASEVQFVDVTDTTLAPGRYWLAIACSSSSATFFGQAAGPASDADWRFEESSAFPLPATATPVETTGYQGYLMGFATTASP